MAPLRVLLSLRLCRLFNARSSRSEASASERVGTNHLTHLRIKPSQEGVCGRKPM